VELKNSFEVPAPPDRVWAFLLDVERVIPCMPGAELTEVVDEKNWKGKVSVKLGPVKMAFAGSVVMEERDDANRRVVLKGKGTETGGKGMVSAVVTSKVEPVGTGARVEILTDLKISGAAAQYGRGMIADVSEHFTAQFAQAMAARLTEPAPVPAAAAPAEGQAVVGGAPAGPPAVAPPPPAPVKPISGLRLGLWLLFRAIVRVLKRIWAFLTGRPKSAD
jgi:uncharacterized protein